MFRQLRQTFVLLCLFVVACLLPAAGCSCDSPAPVLVASYLPCVPQHSPLAVAAPLAQAKSIVPGAVPASYSTTASGNASVSIPLDVVHGRGAPGLTLSYDSSNVAAGPLGLGFAMAGVDTITRCPKTIAIDGEQRAVQYDDQDALCLSGKRLVVVAKHGDTIEYRTFPDEQIKVIGHFEDASASHFEAFFPSGEVITFGNTPATRPRAIDEMPRAWLASEKRDPRVDARCRFTSVPAWPRIIPLDTPASSSIACTGILAVRSPHTEAT